MEQYKSQPTKIGKTWFIERGDGSVFACNELEAWNTMNNRSNWQRQDFKIIGVSDGTGYVKSLQQATQEKVRIDGLINEKSSELTRFLNTYDKFRFDEILPDTDDKVVRVKAIIANLGKDIAELNKQFAGGYQSIANKAFKEELEKARGHIEYPSNQDIMTPRGDKEKILRMMQK